MINPVEHEFFGVEPEKLEDFQRGLRQALYAHGNFYAHEWQARDVVISDNFTLLHGRESFTTHSPRHIQRVQALSNPPFPNPGLQSYK